MELVRLPSLTEAAESSLRVGGSSYIWDRIKSSIEAKTAHVFATNQGSYLALEIQGTELVILAATGHEGPDLMCACIELAKRCNCNFVRFVTKRKGMPRLLKDFELQDHGTIYRIPTYEPNA